MKLCTFCDTPYDDHYTTCGNQQCEGRGSPLVPSRQLERDTVINGKYRILDYVGRGGMGTVYRAMHIDLKEEHALKFIADEYVHNSKARDRLRQEAMAVRRVNDPNVVKVYDLARADNGASYISMEFVPGPSLEKVLKEGPLSVERAIAIARGVASGLAAAHAKGIIHRDIKPGNILLDDSALQGDGGTVPEGPGHTRPINRPETGPESQNGAEVPKLVDFGIAAVKNSPATVSHTVGVMLSPQYAAPEQWNCMPAAEIDGRTDLYALGGVLYEMLTGATCFHSSTLNRWEDQHLKAKPVAPSRLRPEVANWPGLDALILNLLAKDRKNRPFSAKAVIERLDEIQEPPHTPLRPSKALLWIAPVAALVALCIGWAVWHKEQATSPIVKEPPRIGTDGPKTEAPPTNPPSSTTIKPGSRSITPPSGPSVRKDSVLGPPCTPRHPEIDALIESGDNKVLGEDLTGAYKAYSNAESLSCDNYRKQEAWKGKSNVLAECRDRPDLLSCRTLVQTPGP